MIPLYMDEHIPRAITNGLRLKGIDLLTVQEDGFSGKADPELLDRSAYLKRAFFTHDDDLLVEAVKRQREGRDFYGVLYAHHLRISVSGCIKDLEMLSKNGDIEEIKNHVIFLPLKGA